LNEETALYKSAPSSRTRRSRIAGFSMVELAVSMTVLLILTAIAIPSLMRSFRTYQLNDAATRLFDGLRIVPLGRPEGARAGDWRRGHASTGITLAQADSIVARLR